MRDKAGMPAPAAGEGGFTLIEMLAVLAIAALTFALVQGSFRFGQSALTAAAALERHTAEHRAIAAIESRIAAARPVFAAAPDGLSEIVFEGRPDSLRFIAEFDSAPRGGGLYLTDLIRMEQATGEGFFLELRLKPYQDGQIESQDIREPLLSTSSATFRYFGDQGDGQGCTWMAAWQSTKAMPILVELLIGSNEVGKPAARRVIHLKLAQSEQAPCP